MQVPAKVTQGRGSATLCQAEGLPRQPPSGLWGTFCPAKTVPSLPWVPAGARNLLFLNHEGPRHATLVAHARLPFPSRDPRVLPHNPPLSWVRWRECAVCCFSSSQVHPRLQAQVAPPTPPHTHPVLDFPPVLPARERHLSLHVREDASDGAKVADPQANAPHQDGAGARGRAQAPEPGILPWMDGARSEVATHHIPSFLPDP